MEVRHRSLEAVAMDVIRWLVNGIGPRPAGSTAESQAQNGIGERLREWGYTVLMIPAFYAPMPSFEPIFSLSAMAFLASTWLLPVFPWPAFVLPLLALELPEVDSLLERRRKPILRTQNLLALPPGVTPDRVNLLLVAHIDTARANPDSKLWWSLETSVYPAMQILAWLLAILGLIPLLKLNLPLFLQYIAWGGSGILAICLITLDVWELSLPHPRSYSPGAFDNASGVGALTAVAYHLSIEPPKNLYIGFLLTGAEETGMHGASYAAHWLREHNSNPSILVLDQVGAGKNLRYARQFGRLHPIKTSPALNHLLQKAHPTISLIDYLHNSGDFEAFILAGFEAASLERTGSTLAKNAYHTQSDCLNVIEPGSLAATIETVLKFINIMDEESN